MRALVLTVLSGLLLAGGPCAAADADGKGAPPVDVAALTCGDAAALAAADAKGYVAVTVWLDGWLNGKRGLTGYAPGAAAAQAERWLGQCAGTPERTLLAVATESPSPAATADGFDMAFLKCYQFIDLAEEDRPAAVAVIRWNDGWHAAAVGETHVSVKDHEKMTDGFLDGCAVAKYRRKNLIMVMGGKYR
ncbi:HdeA/HdeB family chaperone [Azospirillum sp. ST 5-10]|uniref:HdeA/HdeB family chaperone n=1 Tax=unclassified Azospirillum TaxID=2630922 RepID=UPI003F4A5E4D